MASAFLCWSRFAMRNPPPRSRLRHSDSPPIGCHHRTHDEAPTKHHRLCLNCAGEKRIHDPSQLEILALQSRVDSGTGAAGPPCGRRSWSRRSGPSGFPRRCPRSRDTPSASRSPPRAIPLPALRAGGGPRSSRCASSSRPPSGVRPPAGVTPAHVLGKTQSHVRSGPSRSSDNAATRGGARSPPRRFPCSCRRRWPTPGPR